MSTRRPFVPILLAVLAVGAAPAAAPDLIIRARPLPDGGASVVLWNAGSSPVELDPTLTIERRCRPDDRAVGLCDRGWAVETSLSIADRCGGDAGCRRLGPGSKVQIVPWTGMVGAPQCPIRTPSDYASRPGSYRVVARSCDGTIKHVSVPFQVTESSEG